MILAKVAGDVLLRLGILAVLVLAVSMLAVPDCDCRNGPRAFEGGMAASLRLLADAERQFVAARHVDRDGDGRGELGTLAELAALGELRRPAGAAGAAWRLAPPLLGPSFRKQPIVRGRAQRGGYFLQLYVPAADGGWTAVDDAAADASEQAYCACAWPDGSVDLPLRALFLDADGRMWICENRDRLYWGADRPLTVEAGRLCPAAVVTGDERRLGGDGQVWHRWY